MIRTDAALLRARMAEIAGDAGTGATTPAWLSVREFIWFGWQALAKSSHTGWHW